MELNPSERRDPPIYGDRPCTTTKAPWTAARCNRLLRPLTSRINILKKGKENHIPRGEQRGGPGGPGARLSAESDEKGDPSWIQPGRRTKQHKTYTYRKACPETAASAGSNGTHEPLSITMPGEVTVPTPVIIRARDTSAESSNSELSSEQLLAKLGKPYYYTASRYLSSLKTDTDPATWQLYEGLSSGLDALLKATTPCDNGYSRNSGSHPGRVGAPSLLSMCLRRVSEYIKVEEMWDSLESREESVNCDTDVASAVFSELESLGTSNKGGWKGLLEVVRSHGIRILCDALRDGVLCERVGEVLAWICIDNVAFGEAEAITSTMISAFERYPEPVGIGSPLFHRSICIPLATLNSMATMSSRRGHQFRELEALFRTGRLRKEWLTCCDFTKIWQEAIQALTERNPNYPGAMLFIATAVELTWGVSYGVLDDGTHLLRGGELLDRKLRPPTADRRRVSVDVTEGAKTAQQELLISALDNTVYSVVTTLASIAILNQHFFETESRSKADDSERISPALQLIHRLNTDILRASQLQHAWPRHAAGLSRRVLPTLLTGLFVLPSFAENAREQKAIIVRTLTTLIELSNSRDDSLKGSGMSNTSGAVLDLAYSINSITTCCAKATKDGGFPHISHFIKILQGLVNMSSTSHDLEYKDKRNLHQIAMESSYEFAEQNRTDGLLKWAQGVESWPLGNNSLKFVPTPAKGGRPRHGYQWERDLDRLASESPELARKYHIPQYIDDRRKQPKLKPTADHNKSYQDGSDFEESRDDWHRSRKRRRKNQLPKTPKISAMIVGKHPPTSSPLVPVSPLIHVLSSPTDQLSGGHTIGFGNLPIRLRIDRQQRDDEINHGHVHIRRKNDDDIDELGKSEPSWVYTKDAIDRSKPKRQRPAERSGHRGYSNKAKQCRRVAKKYSWIRKRDSVDDISEDELLG
ncbi:MAG: hypothetical protein M1839_000825 [Geoglossum umbratile]|nr:MAG: hypothetical protein M1839_000825 [Geoglossum umbratile]